MIEDPPLLTIRRNFPRPSAADVAALSGTPTGYLVDAMNGRGALDARIKPIGGNASFCGVAVTCDAGPGDNLAAMGALGVVQAGDVIVCATEGCTTAAVTGDLLLGMLKNSGVVAFVTDGVVRDIVGIRAVGLPCYAAGVTPNSGARNGPGTIGQTIVVGGTTVGPGDVVVGDEDGVVIVPFARIKDVLKRLEAVRAAEASLDAKVKAGLKMPAFIQAMIDAGKFREIG